jgi:hypothetical protein
MNTGFTWDTQNQEFDKKMALETWQQAEQYLKDKAIIFIDIIRTFSCLARKASSPVACVPFKNLTIATCNS